ncbi:MAG: NADH-quinone oxidoreductase subunit J family protein [Nocardioidaceae bacterium]
MSLVEVLFLLLGALAVGSALLVAVGHNLVHCALWLVVTLGALAGCYLILAAEFVAWVQVLIYLGAVVVLLLFALMLTRAPTGPLEDLTSPNRIVAAGTAVAAALVLIVSFAAGFEDASIQIGSGDVGTASALGASLFGVWVLGFELLSVLLLAALVAAIVLSRRQDRA